MSKKTCSISFKSAGDGVPCTTVINGKLLVKGNAVFRNNVSTKKDLNVNNLIFSTETIDESGQEVSPTKSISFINTNGVGELDDACCDGFYKKIIKIIDGVTGDGWTSIGNTGDISGTVYSVAFDQNGDGPYIGGVFNNVAGITGLDKLAKWTGSSWTSVGNTGDFNLSLRTLAFDPSGDGPYIGGDFTDVAGITGLNRLAKWTGSSWTSVGNTGDINQYVNTIVFGPSGDGPYISGNFTDVAGITGLSRLAKWTGSSWTSVGNTGDINFIVNTIVFGPSGDGPYIGGDFTDVAGITGLSKIAKWTGISWTSISGNTGEFFNNGVNTIVFDQNGDGPYVGGAFNNVAGITGLNKLAKWTGSSWTSVGNTGDFNLSVNTIAFDQNGDGPYVGGVFTNVAGITGLNRLAKWTGSSWTSVGNTGDISSTVRSIVFEPSGDGPYVGGAFNNVAGITGLNYLAKYNDSQQYTLTYNDTETLTLTNKGDEATLVYNTNPTNSWIKLT